MELSIPPPTDEEPDLELAQHLRQRNRRAMIGVCAVLLALVGFGVFKKMRRRAPVIPVEASTGHANAFGLLRRDDFASKSKATQFLDDLLSAHPGFVQARSTQLIALALQVDDLKFEIKHLEAKYEQLNQGIQDLQQKKEPSDWENRVNALRDQASTIKRDSAPLIAQATALDKRTNDAFTALQLKGEDLQPGDELYIARAQAVYLGVKGSERASELAEKYRSLGGKDGWDAIAIGEFTVNAKVPVDTINSSRLSLDRLRSRDPAFLRAYLIGARQALILGQYEAAASLLEAVGALNPSHELGRKMIGWVQELQTSARSRTATGVSALPSP